MEGAPDRYRLDLTTTPSPERVQFVQRLAWLSLASLAVLLIWLYYSAQIFLFGAELTRAFADRFGAKIEPTKNAMAIPKPCGSAHDQRV